MSIHYFIVNSTDATQDMLEKAVQTNIYTVRKSKDALKWLLKFKDRNVPIELFRLGYTRLTPTELEEQIVNSEDWR